MEESLEEIWKPIKGYEGLFEISNLKKVRCVVKGHERLITTYGGKIPLFKDGVIKWIWLSSLYKEHFKIEE